MGPMALAGLVAGHGQRLHRWLDTTNPHVLVALMLVGLLLLDAVVSILLPFLVFVWADDPDPPPVAPQENASAPAPLQDDEEPPAPAERPRGAYLSELWEDYRMHKMLTLMGFYLVALPAMWVTQGELIWFPWQPFVWLAAVGAIIATWRSARAVPVLPRALYALAFGLVVSGFAAQHWSTLGA